MDGKAGTLMDIAVPIGTYIASTYGQQYGQGAATAAKIWDTSKQTYRRQKLGKALMNEADRVAEAQEEAEMAMRGARLSTIAGAGDERARAMGERRPKATGLEGVSAASATDSSIKPMTGQKKSASELDPTIGTGLVNDRLIDALKSLPREHSDEFSEYIGRMAVENPEMAMQTVTNRKEAIANMKQTSAQMLADEAVNKAKLAAEREVRLAAIDEQKKQAAARDATQRLIADLGIKNDVLMEEGRNTRHSEEMSFREKQLAQEEKLAQEMNKIRSGKNAMNPESYFDLAQKFSDAAQGYLRDGWVPNIDGEGGTWKDPSAEIQYKKLMTQANDLAEVAQLLLSGESPGKPIPVDENGNPIDPSAPGAAPGAAAPLDAAGIEAARARVAAGVGSVPENQRGEGLGRLAELLRLAGSGGQAEPPAGGGRLSNIAGSASRGMLSSHIGEGGLPKSWEGIPGLLERLGASRAGR